MIVSTADSSLQQLVADCPAGPPPPVAMVQPADAASLGCLIEAQRAGLVEPILVGEPARLRAAAALLKVDLEGLRLVPARDDQEAASLAVQLVRNREAAVLMKGLIHTDDFMRAILDKETGLRTNRRISHAFVCCLPTPVYPKPLLLTDAVVNIAPDLETKRHIVQNAIDLAHSLGIAQPKVAILAAVETVTAAMPATIDAAALCKMAERGQLRGAIVDGPLAFDNAVSLEAARTKGIESPVAGNPDILVVPNLEAGNMLYKEMTYFAGAITPGLVLGASVPIILTSRADPPAARLASCQLACRLAHRSELNTEASLATGPAGKAN